MITKIGTGRCTATIDSRGAELKSLRDESQEYIWCGDPSWWSGTAPLLFPNIGGFTGGSYRYRGSQYSIGSHGFARNEQFTLIESSENHAVFQLLSQERLKEIFPFRFQLLVTFTMDYSGISTTCTVRNIGSSNMYFSIGFHPAFALPFDGGLLEHYYIEFDRSEDAGRYFFIDGCMGSRKEDVLSNSRHIFLNRKIFDAGPLMFRDIRSKSISIRKSRSMKRITLHADSPCLAVWSKPGGAPFVCIEPWHGMPDPVGYTGSLEDKPGIICLEYREQYSAGYSIEIE